MKKTLLTSMLVASVVGGSIAMEAAAQDAKDGFYLRPEAEIIFVDSAYTKGVTSVGVGGGAGLAFGYSIDNFQIDLATNYQYYGGEGTVNQAIAGGAGTLATTVDSVEHFIPITLGLNYVIPIVDGFSITPGIAGGVWLHAINRDINVNANLNQQLLGQLQLGAQAGNAQAIAQLQALQGLAGAAPTKDEAFEVRGVVVPSLSFDYLPLDNLAINFRTRFYLVPAGYSDNYAGTNRALANLGASRLTPSYNAVNDFFWYGSINIGVQYTF